MFLGFSKIAKICQFNEIELKFWQKMIKKILDIQVYRPVTHKKMTFVTGSTLDIQVYRLSLKSGNTVTVVTVKNTYTIEENFVKKIIRKLNIEKKNASCFCVVTVLPCYRYLYNAYMTTYMYCLPVTVVTVGWRFLGK